MTWKHDEAHTNVGFSARHLMFSTVRGRFERVRTEITLDPDQPEQSAARLEIDAASVSTNDATRDAHLRSADFFDVERHPLITFASTAVDPVSAGKYRIAGDLTIRGVTKSITLDGELHGVAKTPFGTTVAGISVSGSVDRRDWGLIWNVPLEGSGLLVGDTVKLEADLELVLQTSAAEEAA